MWKKIIIGIAVFALVAFAFLTWYKIHYSMDIVKSFEVNTPDLKQKVLIATQGSEFKNAVVAEIIGHLKQRHVYIKVIDVTALPQMHENNWDAVVLIHTFENMKPPAEAKAYVAGIKDLSKVIVLTTSGQGGYKMAGVNAISSASKMADVSKRASEINKRLDSILDKDSKK